MMKLYENEHYNPFNFITKKKRKINNFIISKKTKLMMKYYQLYYVLD